MKLAMLGVAALLCGCAVMSESECVTADWHAVGERDGRDGRVVAHLEKYYDACAQFGVYPDDEAYREGREQGLTVYCTEDSGYPGGPYRAGLSGGLSSGPGALFPGGVQRGNFRAPGARVRSPR